jgi:hypothetical protein
MTNFKVADYISVFLIVILCTACAEPSMQDDGNIQFKIHEYDFTTISLKQVINYSFEFSNPGENPLVIYEVRTSCGCTAADWTKKPVKPGESGEITVTYDATFPGTFHKEISVFYNGPDSPAKLEIKGQVEYPDGLKAEK